MADDIKIIIRHDKINNILNKNILILCFFDDKI